MGLKCTKRSYEVNDDPDVAAAGTSDVKNGITTRNMTSTSPDGRTLAFVCKTTDLKENECKAFDVSKVRFLLVKNSTGFHAVGNKCTHYGAPLGKGAYCNGRVRCPWHGATFSVETGDIEDFPGLDSLPKYELVIENDDVKLVVPEVQYEGGKRTKSMCKRENQDLENTVVIVGGGAGATACAETLRQQGHAGPIKILTEEPHYPYDRPKLSKQMDVEVAKIYLRPPIFYSDNGIEVMLNSRVVAVDTTDRELTLENRETVRYGKLVLATGGRARTLNCPGNNLKGVCYIRTPEDSQKASRLVKEGMNLVIIGSSFIGMETAACLVKKGANTIAIDVLGTPFEMVLGAKVGSAMKKLHESNGVKFYLNSGVSELRGNDANELTHVVLKDGTALPADLCIAGIGCVPNTDFVKDGPISMDSRGFIKVDGCLRTNVENVWACGDIASFPLTCFDLPSVNIQHWQMALKHGMTAALSIVGKNEPVNSVPFFWSAMFGKSLRYTGYGPGYDDIIINGNVEDYKFAAYYLKEGKLRAVGTIGVDPCAAQIAELLLAKKTVTKQDIEKNTTNDWSSWLQEL